ncbi:MAG: metallophosphoesterase [Clostridia bacterium]
MKVFAIGDLHLSLNADKPMDVFGEKWDNHFERIADAWQDRISSADIVLIPGDISWAMRMEDAIADLDAISALNGQKLIMKGNHDYWWNSLTRVRGALKPGMAALQNDAFFYGNMAVAGSRGWITPENNGFDPSNTKIYERELARLTMSLKAAGNGAYLIGMIHYPPLSEKHGPTGFTELFEGFGAKHVVYGHLHGKACKNAFEGERNGTEYTLCSADHIEFCPKLITEL